MKTSLPANQQRLMGASRKRQMNSLRSVAAGSVALPGPRLAPAPTLRCNGAPGSGWGLGHFSPSPNPVLTDLLTGSATVTWPEFADGERGWASWARRTGEAWRLPSPGQPARDPGVCIHHGEKTRTFLYRDHILMLRPFSRAAHLSPQLRPPSRPPDRRLQLDLAPELQPVRPGHLSLDGH